MWWLNILKPEGWKITWKSSCRRTVEIVGECVSNGCIQYVSSSAAHNKLSIQVNPGTISKKKKKKNCCYRIFVFIETSHYENDTSANPAECYKW